VITEAAGHSLMQESPCLAPSEAEGRTKRAQSRLYVGTRFLGFGIVKDIYRLAQ
jgi:hypothetical protein